MRPTIAILWRNPSARSDHRHAQARRCAASPISPIDNQLALNAGWDRELLGLELGELKLGDLDGQRVA